MATTGGALRVAAATDGGGRAVHTRTRQLLGVAGWFEHRVLLGAYLRPEERGPVGCNQLPAGLCGRRCAEVNLHVVCGGDGHRRRRHGGENTLQCAERRLLRHHAGQPVQNHPTDEGQLQQREREAQQRRLLLHVRGGVGGALQPFRQEADLLLGRDARWQH